LKNREIITSKAKRKLKEKQNENGRRMELVIFYDSKDEKNRFCGKEKNQSSEF